VTQPAVYVYAWVTEQDDLLVFGANAECVYTLMRIARSLEERAWRSSIN